MFYSIVFTTNSRGVSQFPLMCSACSLHPGFTLNYSMFTYHCPSWSCIIKKINIRHIWFSVLRFVLKCERGTMQFLQTPCREQLPAATATWPSHWCAPVNLEHTAQSILSVAGEVLPSAVSVINNSKTGVYYRMKKGGQVHFHLLNSMRCFLE